MAVHEIGQYDGQHYFSMDYVAGRTLAEIVRDGPLPVTRAATCLKTIAGAVHYAHQHGIIHRDLKPANVIIDQNDQPRITDFGLAKRFYDSAFSSEHSALTISGQILGSPNYIPPEQAEPKRSALGPPSDVYALGAILYESPPGPGARRTSLRYLRGHTAAVMAVAWSLDDQWIATGSKDNSARIWDVRSGTQRLILTGHSGLIHAVAFSPDGALLATGSADGSARLWSTLSGQCLRVLTNRHGAVLSLAFSPDGHWLATGSSDGSASLRDAATGQEVHLLLGHINGVRSVAFSPEASGW